MVEIPSEREYLEKRLIEIEAQYFNMPLKVPVLERSELRLRLSREYIEIANRLADLNTNIVRGTDATSTGVRTEEMTGAVTVLQYRGTAIYESRSEAGERAVLFCDVTIAGKERRVFADSITDIRRLLDQIADEG